MFANSLALMDRVKAELALVKADRKGVAALEYGIMAGVIAGVIIAIVIVLGGQLNGIFTALSGTLGGVTGA